MADTTPLAPTDAELLGLNVGEVYFSESPSKYPEVHGTQYHAGAPGVLAFAREALAKWGAQPVVPAGYALVPVEASEDMKAAAVKYANGAAVYKNVRAEVLRIEEGIYGEVYAAMLKAAPQPSPAAQGDALDAACQRACMELPEGMSMAIQLERDAGWIELHGSYGDQIELPNADGSLAEQVHQAIEAARAAQEDK